MPDPIDIGEAFKIKGNQGIRGAAGYETIGQFVSAILPNVYIIAGLLIFILFIAGGVVIMTSGGSPDQQGKGAKAISAAVAGFLIIFLSYWIIQIIEYITGVDIFQPGV